MKRFALHDADGTSALRYFHGNSHDQWVTTKDENNGVCFCMGRASVYACTTRVIFQLNYNRKE